MTYWPDAKTTVENWLGEKDPYVHLIVSGGKVSGHAYVQRFPEKLYHEKVAYHLDMREYREIDTATFIGESQPAKLDLPPPLKGSQVVGLYQACQRYIYDLERLVTSVVVPEDVTIRFYGEPPVPLLWWFGFFVPNAKVEVI